MRIYLAASLTMREHIITVAERIRQKGHIVECRWFGESLGSDDPKFLAARASDNLADIGEADIFVRFSDTDVVSEFAGPTCRTSLATGGRHFECGYAYALGKKVVVVGGHQNVFDWLPDVVHLRDEEQLLESLSTRPAPSRSGPRQDAQRTRQA